MAKPKSSDFFSGALLAAARAIESGNIAVLENTLQSADPNQIGREDMTLLMFALAHADSGAGNQTIELLVRSGANPLHVVPGIGSAVDVVLIKKNEEIFRAMLRAGLAPNVRRSDQPLLIDAVRYGIPMVRALAEAGADINAFNSLGQTPLYMSLINIDLQIANYLLDRGADPGKIDINGRSAAHVLFNTMRRFKPGSPSMKELEALRDRMIRMGVKWPPS